MQEQNKSIKQVLFYLVLAFQVPQALVIATKIMPRVDPLREPYFDLNGLFAQVVYVITASGGVIGITVLTVLLILLLVSRSSLTLKAGLQESLVLLAICGLFLAGGAWTNEHFIKPALGIPRPYIVEMSQTPDAQGTVLDLTPGAFYDLGSKEDRSAYLESIKTEEGFYPIQMSNRIQNHWIHTTGFSQPSGHAMTALLFMTFFLGMALTYLEGRRRQVFYLLVPWAVLVCYSRLILRVHAPDDIILGAVQGALLGMAAFAVTRLILDKTRYGTDAST